MCFKRRTFWVYTYDDIRQYRNLLLYLKFEILWDNLFSSLVLRCSSLLCSLQLILWIIVSLSSWCFILYFTVLWIVRLKASFTADYERTLATLPDPFGRRRNAGCRNPCRFALEAHRTVTIKDIRHAILASLSYKLSWTRKPLPALIVLFPTSEQGTITPIPILDGQMVFLPRLCFGKLVCSILPASLPIFGANGVFLLAMRITFVPTVHLRSTCSANANPHLRPIFMFLVIISLRLNVALFQRK